MEQDNVYTRITVTKASDKDNSINAGQYPSFVVNLSNSITGVSSVDLGDAITRSENAANAAKTSQTEAKKSENAAKASADASATSLANIKDSEAKAKASADAAKTSETNAKASETKAKTSETNAKASETKAATSAQAAADSAGSVSDEAAQAAASASAAKTSENAAKASQTAAATSEVNSANSAGAAKDSASKAKVSETNAKTSETNAKTSETNAKTSETNAAASAKAAADVAESISDEVAQTAANAIAAKKSEDAAKASQTAAAASEVNSAASAEAAKGSETNAKASEDAAKTSETNAKTSETNAKTSETEADRYQALATSMANASRSSAGNSATSANNSRIYERSAETYASTAKEAQEEAAKSQEAAKISETNSAESAAASASSAAEAKRSEDAAKEAAMGLPTIENTDKRYPKVRIHIPNGTDILEFFKTAKTGFYFSTKDVVNGFGDDTNYIWTNGRDDITSSSAETTYGVLTAYTYNGYIFMKVLNKGFWNGTRDVVVTASGGTTFEDLVVQKSSANRLKMVTGATQRENRISFHDGLSTLDGNMSAFIGFPGGSTRFFISNEKNSTAIEISDQAYFQKGNNRSMITTELSLGGTSFFPRGVVAWNSTPPAYNAGSGMYKMGQGADDATIINFSAQDDKMYAGALQFRFIRSHLGSLKYRIAGFNSTDFPMGWLDIVTQIQGKQYYRDDNAFFGAGTQTDAIKFGMPNTGVMIQAKFAENRKGQLFLGEDGSIKTRWVAEVGKGGDIAWVDVLDSNNTTRDPNGFIKIASPVVKVFKDSCTTNKESEGVTFEKLGVGHYVIHGTLGFNSDGGWGIRGGVVVPKDENDQPLLWVNTKILPNGDIEIKTYHRQHDNVPEQFQNTRIKEIEGDTITYYTDGEAADIPDNTWLDVRVQMPEDSIYSRKLLATRLENEKIEEERLAALEAERIEALEGIEQTEKQIQEDGWTVPPRVEEPTE
ncbi:hypothetical protein [Providencia phage PSTCR5]|uniref:Phage tail protein C-terminal domain-containing protein n=1 Tax=Providencia phage PSTCR5 TaxID=2783547 RepID=A0A873WHS1_9CAUD|nr:tail fiber protein [Providencia phage PSTCR5]QPB12123.1 hypothetical protein [Providencia phage PSTCR5]